jgi:hypothetical protein
MSTKKFKQMCEVYKLFVDKDLFDFSDEMMEEMFQHETYGKPVSRNTNGYYVGKKCLNVTVDMWKHDIPLGLLTIHELYENGEFPSWWLDSIFKNFVFELNPL